MVALIEPFSPTGGETPFEPGSGRFDEKLVIAVLQMICSVILVFDVGGEIHAAMQDDQPTNPLLGVQSLAQVAAVHWYQSWQQSNGGLDSCLCSQRT